MFKEWFTALELAELKLKKLPKHKTWVIDKANRENWAFRERQAQGGGREYHISSLPEVARLDLAIKMADPNFMAGSAEASRIAIREESQKLLKQKKMAKFLALPKERQYVAEVKAIIVDGFCDYEKIVSVGLVKARLLFTTAFNQYDLLTDSFVRDRIKHITERSLFTWCQIYEEAGLVGLAGNYGKTKGKKLIENTTDFENFIAAFLYEFPHAKTIAIYQGIEARFTGKVNDLPSLRSVQRWVKEYKQKNEQLLLAVKNPDAWRSKFQIAAGSQSEGIIRLNQRWEYDSTPTDIMLNDGKRHNIVGVIDVYSRRLKLLVSKSSSAEAVATITRNCLLKWGVPETVKTDNGADYVSKRIKRIFDGLSIRQDLCKPFTPEGKPHIERAFRTFSHDILELLPGYVGHNVTERKDIEARRSFAKRILGEDKDPIELNCSPEELQGFCDNWIETIYHHNEHGGLNGKTPFEMIVSYKGKIQKISDERALDILLAEAPSNDGLRTITKKGIRLDGVTFIHEKLAGFEGRQVKVRYDESEYGEVYVFDAENGSFICKAFNPEHLGVSRKEVAIAQKRRQKKIISEGKKALKQIAKDQKTRDIKLEILEYRKEQVENLVVFPQGNKQQSQDYVTETLNEASRALKIAPKARELTADEKQALVAVEQDLKPTNIVKMPETKEQKYARWLEIDKRLTSGEDASSEEIKWWRNYQLGSEFATQKALVDLGNKEKEASNTTMLFF
ncbi:MAG: transposase [Alphaproteobacteria bacterium]